MTQQYSEEEKLCIFFRSFILFSSSSSSHASFYSSPSSSSFFYPSFFPQRPLSLQENRPCSSYSYLLYRGGWRHYAGLICHCQWHTDCGNCDLFSEGGREGGNPRQARGVRAIFRWETKIKTRSPRTQSTAAGSPFVVLWVSNWHTHTHTLSVLCLASCISCGLVYACKKVHENKISWWLRRV